MLRKIQQLFGNRRDRTADEAALAALEDLPAGDLPRLNALLEVLHEYIEARYGYPVTGRSVREAIALIPRYPLLGRRAKLVEFLVAAELARHADRMPLGYVREAERYVRRFIESTREDP